ncbi:chloramphenicol acetyltransferase [Mucilaginibacter agri]|uniref:Chloramphenicol acetyltransferase n=1 Tax=Mucilaginibacter agri TaxID=2695265 RepID=A0A965ZKV7_9SPHI|nr:chloramphenicol acetyltransferase [Mucilaginibacter agri]NCD71893.1 chloramphenicol acetyltransferase [Mucilaginibacter agri]
MKQKLDLDSWNRKEHFKFFNQFEEPYYGVNVTIDCTTAYKAAKQNGVSFFLYYLYQSLSAAQIIEPFKLRIEEDEVFIYDRVDAGSTIGRPDGTFGFGDFIYYATFNEFYPEALKVMERVSSSTTLDRSPAKNVIRYSPLPWIDFTALSHARMFSFKDSCPKISFGKMTDNSGKRTMPVSIHVHHALVDGLHVGQYIDCYQQLLNTAL